MNTLPKYLGRLVLISLVLFFVLGAFPRPTPAAERSPSKPAAGLPDASWDRLPRWRGFNLLSKFSKDWSNGPFPEEDFKLISELGFNFVRLPLDYRVWVQDGDWNKIDENVIREIDQAVEWGGKYGIHVCINLHRAPGYCINPPKEARDLWNDPEAQKVCAKHWALFAKRYKGIPNSRLSFNLFNEPTGVDAGTYLKVAGLMAAAIRKEDPKRLILSDGINGGKDPMPELIPLKLAQACRGYQPFSLTHYRAPWVEGSSGWPEPQWPSALVTAFLYGPVKPEYHMPWVVEGFFDEESELRFHVDTVSQDGTLRISADGKTIFEKQFKLGPGEGEWKKAEYKEEWKIYQNLYDRDYTAVIPPKTRRIEIVMVEGDWLTFSALEITPKDGGKSILVRPTNRDWGVKPNALYLTQDGVPDSLKNTGGIDRAWLKKSNVDAWKAFEAKGAGVMVGEWGAYNKTPHDVALRWMKDCLENWKEAGFGWALWNFRGDFGVLDSNRADVLYEDWQGHRLDRRMLELLQAY